MKFRGHIHKRDIALLIVLTCLFLYGGLSAFDQHHINLTTALVGPGFVSGLLWLLYGLSVL